MTGKGPRIILRGSMKKRRSCNERREREREREERRENERK